MEGMTEMAMCILTHDVEKDLQDSNGKTALMLCSSKGKSSLVDALCSAKCKLNLLDKNERTCAMIFAASGKSTLIRVLIKYGANLDISNFCLKNSYLWGKRCSR